MKKVLLAIAFIGMLSAVVFAGGINPYIVVEKDGLQTPSLTIGVDWSARLGTSNWSFAFDGAYVDADLLTLQSPIQIDLGLDFGWEQSLQLEDPAESIDYGIVFTLEETLIFKPAVLEPDLFEPALGVLGFYGPIKVWVEGAFPYNGTNWGFVPTVGISIGK